MSWLDDFETNYDIQFAKEHPELDDVAPSPLGGEVARLDKKLTAKENPNAMGAPKNSWLEDFEKSYSEPVKIPKVKTLSEEEQRKADIINFATIGNTPEALVEGATNLGTGLLASAVGGVKGLYEGVFGDGLDEATNKIQETQQALTYAPRTEKGRKVAEIAAMPIEYGSKVAGFGGEMVGRHFAGEQGAIAGRSFGEASVPIAATLMGGASALKGAKNLPQPPAIPVISSVVKGIRDVARTYTKSGKEALAQEFLQKMTTPSEASKLVTALQNGKEIVPNSPVTSADAIAQANRGSIISGRPDRYGSQYVALQEGLSKVPETSAELVKIKLQQEHARNTILETEAGTDASYSNAATVRKINAEKNYSPLVGEKLISDTSLSNLLNRPSMEIATNIASNLAKEKGETFQLYKSTPEQVVEIYNPLTMAKDKVVIPKKFAEYSTQGLQFTKLALDKMISNPSDYGITKAQVKAIVQTRRSLIDWIENKSSVYKKANDAYAIDSVPIQQMDLWRLLKDKYQAPTGKESAGVYLRMLRDETKAVKDATGWQKSKGFDEIFDTRQSALANRLAVEMENNLVKSRMASEINTPNVGNPTKGIEPTLPNMLMREAMIANFLLKNLAQKANVDVNIAASRILADPKLLSNTLKQVKPIHRPSLLKYIKNASMGKTSAVLTLSNAKEQEK